ncbi:UNVERIFIED_CONTAM: Phf5a [Trichonephila clavipes]
MPWTSIRSDLNNAGVSVSQKTIRSRLVDARLKGDGKCVICDSYVRPCTLVRICDECNYGSYQGRCVICGGPGVSDAYYCKECTIQEKDRDGCPKIVNLGSSKTDLFYERKKYGFKKR